MCNRHVSDSRPACPDCVLETQSLLAAEREQVSKLERALLSAQQRCLTLEEIPRYCELPPAEPDEADDEPQAGGPAMTEDEVWMVLEKHPRMIAQRAAAREVGRVEGLEQAIALASEWGSEFIATELRQWLAARRPGGAAPDGRGGK